MIQKRLEAGRQVFESLKGAERGGSAALRTSMALMSTMLDAQEEIGMGPIFGQDAIDHTAAAIRSISEGMNHLRDAHMALGRHKVEAGLRTRMIGDGEWTPTSPYTEGHLAADAQPKRHLQSVPA